MEIKKYAQLNYTKKRPLDHAIAPPSAALVVTLMPRLQ